MLTYARASIAMLQHFAYVWIVSDNLYNEIKDRTHEAGHGEKFKIIPIFTQLYL